MANTMRLTLQLNAIDNMSKVVSSAANRSMRSLNTMAQTAQQRANRARNNMFESGVMAAGGVAALAYPVKMAANYEMLRIRMVALTQSQADGMRLYRQTIKLASETPLTLEQVAQATTRLIGFGRTAKDAIVDVKMLGDVVTLAGGDINAAMVAYGQAAGEGRVMTRDLTQFVNAGVPIFKMLGEVTGANGAELKKMAEQGQLSFALLEEAFKKSTSSGGQFANGMKKMSASASGGWVRMTDELGRFADVFGSSVLPMLKSWNEALIPIISGTAEWFRNHKLLTKLVMGSAGLFTGIATATLLYSGAVWMLNSALVVAAGSAFQFILLHSGMFALWSGLGTLFNFLFFNISAYAGGLAYLASSSAFATSVMEIGLVPALLKVAAAVAINPITWIVVAIGAMIAYIGVAVYKWREFGASMMLLFGPVGWIVNAFMSIKTHWDSITSSFRDGGFFEGIKRIGVVLMDSMLYPIQQLMGLIAKVTGFDWAKSAQDSILKFRVSHDLAGAQKTASVVSGSARQGNETKVSAIGPTAASQMVGGSGNSTSINYNPTITIGAGTSAEDRGSFAAMLEQHKNEMARMVQDVMRQDKRKQFSVA